MWKWVVLSVVLCSGFVIWKELPASEVQIVFCDVGQGDAILVIDGFHQMLVDGGRRETEVLACLGRYMPFWDRTLEVVVGTHPDADHIGGLVAVIERFTVEMVIYEPEEKDTAVFKQFNEVVSRKASSGATQWVIPVQGMELQLSDRTRVTVLSKHAAYERSQSGVSNPTETILWDKIEKETDNNAARKNYNDGSIVLKVESMFVQALLTGDLEVPGEQALLFAKLIEPTNILKVGHHGSKTSSSMPFIEYLQPEVSVISVGENNRYGHPVPQVVENLEAVGSSIFRTDLEGDILVSLEEAGYFVSTSSTSRREYFPY